MPWSFGVGKLGLPGLIYVDLGQMEKRPETTETTQSIQELDENGYLNQLSKSTHDTSQKGQKGCQYGLQHDTRTIKQPQ